MDSSPAIPQCNFPLKFLCFWISLSQQWSCIVRVDYVTVWSEWIGRQIFRLWASENCLMKGMCWSLTCCWTGIWISFELGWRLPRTQIPGDLPCYVSLWMALSKGSCVQPDCFSFKLLQRCRCLQMFVSNELPTLDGHAVQKCWEARAPLPFSEGPTSLFCRFCFTYSDASRVLFVLLRCPFGVSQLVLSPGSGIEGKGLNWVLWLE